MKALVYKGISSYPDLEDINIKSQPKSIEVKIKASALNHRDIWILKGMYAGLNEGAIMGADGTGTVDGKDVVIYPGVEWGDNEDIMGEKFRVLGMPDHGTFADILCTQTDYIFEKPKHLSTDEAAALPLAGLTAYRALVVKGEAKRNQNVLISGIGGGVALTAFQFALALGCNVYVTSSSEDKITKAISLGAKGGFNYKDANWHKELIQQIGGIDLTIDSAGGEGFNNFLKVANPGGRIVTYGGTAGKIKDLSPQILFWKQLSIHGTTMGSLQDFSDMVDFVTDFEVKPVVDSVYDFKDYKKAFDRIRSGNQFGKVVLQH